MSTHEFLPNTPTAYVQAAGTVFVIRCVPDIFTNERINIGVCATDADGNRKAKVITKPGRLKSLYGEASLNVVLLAQAALHAATEGVPSPSPQVLFDKPTPYYNSTLDEVIDNTFADQVTVALPYRKNSDPAKKTDKDVLQEVSNRIKTKHELDFDFLTKKPQLIIDTDRGPRKMIIPFQPKNGVGVVRSAYYSAATLKKHLMDSVFDLHYATQHLNKWQSALFILSPKHSSPKEWRAQRNAIDYMVARSPFNLYLQVSDDVEALADMVMEWVRYQS